MLKERRLPVNIEQFIARDREQRRLRAAAKEESHKGEGDLLEVHLGADCVEGLSECVSEESCMSCLCRRSTLNTASL